MKNLLIDPPPTVFLPLQLSSIEVGNIICGYVYKIESYGVIINFGGKVRGLALKSELSDYFIKNISDFYEVNQSVICSVLEINNETNHLILSLKRSKLLNVPDYVSPFFKEKQLLANSNPDLNYLNYPIGKTIRGKILFNKDYGIIISLDNNVTGLALKPYHTYNVGVEIDTEIDCCILDIDQANQIVYVTLRNEYINNNITDLSLINKTINNKETVNATVLNVKNDDTMILSVPSLNNVIVVTSLISYNILHSKYNDYEIGKTIPIILYSISEEKNHKILFGSVKFNPEGDKSSYNPKKRQYSIETSRSVLPSSTIKIGEVYKAKIITIYSQSVFLYYF